MSETPPIKPRDRDAILQALATGVVPRRGQHLIQVGRAAEIEALLKDVERVSDGGASFRLVIGDYGSGKTFFLHLIRAVSLEKGLITVHADLSPGRRLYATGGQARALYSQLMQNAATRSKPDGGAMPAIVGRFVSTASAAATELGHPTSTEIANRLASLSELAGGYEFAQVVGCYWRGYDDGDEQLMQDAIRWLRGEFLTRTDARAALGVRGIIDDSNLVDSLKLFARFARLSGYGGVIVFLDEMVNLYKLANTRTRNQNYEQILNILNDTLGAAEGLGFVMGGTPEFLLDPHKGLYSYEALQSRLAENPYATGGLVDLSGPIIKLENLQPEDLFLLLTKVRNVFASGASAGAETAILPDEGIEGFMAHCSSQIGDAYFRTPRNSIKSFVSLLSVLEQNPQAEWQELMPGIKPGRESNPDLEPLPDESGDQPETRQEAADGDELSSFKL